MYPINIFFAGLYKGDEKYNDDDDDNNNNNNLLFSIINLTS